MRIYIDDECKCHVSDNGGCRAFDVAFFDDKCKAFIEGYRYIPAGETWTRNDGVQFTGEMLSLWKPDIQLAIAQEAYEQAKTESGDTAELMRELDETRKERDANKNALDAVFDGVKYVAQPDNPFPLVLPMSVRANMFYSYEDKRYVATQATICTVENFAEVMVEF